MILRPCVPAIAFRPRSPGLDSGPRNGVLTKGVEFSSICLVQLPEFFKSSYRAVETKFVFGGHTLPATYFQGGFPWLTAANTVVT